MTGMPLARAASSTATVPVRLTECAPIQSCVQRTTLAIAARWNTPSTPAIAAWTNAASVTLPRASSAAGARFSIRPVERSSTTLTVSPRASRASTRCDPIKPHPPVTRKRRELMPPNSSNAERTK